MIAVLRNPTYARLFGAQVIALLGTGLLTVALGLLAFDIAGSDAGIVLGTAMTIKMVAYVVVAPVVTALVARLPRKPVLVGADLARAGVAVCLPFVSEAWHVYLLIALLQSASATFTPTFQAVIPSVLPDEEDYTRALSLSRLAYDIESLVSPMLAAALLVLISYHSLFVGTVVGFLASASLVVASRLPEVQIPPPTRFLRRLSDGARAFWSSRELRGLIGLNLVVAAATAMVIVNTAVLVQGELGGSPSDVALLLGAYGGGSMAVALGMTKLLSLVPDRRAMLSGGVALSPILCVAAGVIAWIDGTPRWPALLLLWLLLGGAASSVLTPTAHLLRRNSEEVSRPAVFAAQFSLSHACFLITYPLAGALGAAAGLPVAAAVLGAVGAVGVAATLRTWSRLREPAPCPCARPDLWPDRGHSPGGSAASGASRHGDAGSVALTRSGTRTP